MLKMKNQKKLHDVKKKVVAPKKKLRKISLADIESEIGSSSKRPSKKNIKRKQYRKV